MNWRNHHHHHHAHDQVVIISETKTDGKERCGHRLLPVALPAHPPNSIVPSTHELNCCAYHGVHQFSATCGQAKNCFTLSNLVSLGHQQFEFATRRPARKAIVSNRRSCCRQLQTNKLFPTCLWAIHHHASFLSLTNSTPRLQNLRVYKSCKEEKQCG